MLECVWSLKTEESESIKGVEGRVNEELESNRGEEGRVREESFKEGTGSHI